METLIKIDRVFRDGSHARLSLQTNLVYLPRSSVRYSFVSGRINYALQPLSHNYESLIKVIIQTFLVPFASHVRLHLVHAYLEYSSIYDK